MESIGDILKRKATSTRSTSGESTNDSSSADSLEQPPCPLCGGAGFVYPDVPRGHPDFGKVVPCQCTQRVFQEERLFRLQRYSNLGSLARLTFENLLSRGRGSDPENQERFSRALAKAREFAEHPRGWLVFTGPSGCGKTHLAAAIANRCLTKGMPAFFVVVPDLLDHLRGTFNPSSEVAYDELFEQVREAYLLILDDLGTQRSTPWAEEKLFQIVNHRFNAQKPTVVTTSVSPEELDERLRTRLTDPALSEVCLLEERTQALLDDIGSLGLELLRNMRFENFDQKRVNLTPEEQENLGTAFKLARDFAESPEGWLIFRGRNGCGKTHLVAAIANYQLQRGKPVRFEVVPDLLDHFRSTFNQDSKSTYDELFERVKLAPLLILDDLGTQSATPWAQEKLYQIINYRYNGRLPTVITTSYSLDEIEDRLSSRMVDVRLSTAWQIIAPDYRADRELQEKPKASPRGRRGR